MSNIQIIDDYIIDNINGELFDLNNYWDVFTVNQINTKETIYIELPCSLSYITINIVLGVIF